MLSAPAIVNLCSKSAGIVAIVGLGACSVAPPGTNIHDPFETSNRKVHAFNKSIDRAALRPAGNAYGAVVPDPIDAGIQNFADNLGAPQNVVNHTLQGDLENATLQSLRFVINSTVGLLGLFDPATVMGIPDEDTDFGETLHVWGVQEGAYLEVPFLGPTNERDLAGTVVDMATDPLGYVVSYPEKGYVTGARVAGVLDSRHEFGETVDSILYDSADSYAQLRLLSVQNRRFELGSEAGQDTSAAATAVDEELYDDSYFD